MPSTTTATTTTTSYNPATNYSSNLYTNVNGASSSRSTASTFMNAAPKNSSSSTATMANGRPRPPATIAHLNSLTEIPESDPRIPLKTLLKSADSFRLQAQEQEAAGDIENAFVAYGVAAKYALERVPAHCDYGEKLTREQRLALGKNGEKILERLSSLKDALIARQEDWRRKYGSDAPYPPPTSMPPFRPPPAESIPPQQMSQKYSSASHAASAAKRDAALQSARQAATSSYSSQNQQQKDAVMENVRAAASSSRYVKSQKETALEAARTAASSAQNGSSHTVVYAPEPSVDVRRREQQEEFRRREEEIIEKKRREKRTMPAPPVQHTRNPSSLQSHPTMPSISGPTNGPSIPTYASMPSMSNPAPPMPSAPSRSEPRSVPPPSQFQSHQQQQRQPANAYTSTSSGSASQLQPQSTGYSQYSTSMLQPQATGSSQHSGGISPQYTGMSSGSTSTNSTQQPSRPPAKIPPQYQLPPMPPPASYPPLQSRLQNGRLGGQEGTRPITDNGTLTPQRQAPRPPQQPYATPTRDDARYSDVSGQFNQMTMEESQSQSNSSQSTPLPHLMPLESPTKYGYEGDSTDSETAARAFVRREKRDHNTRRGEARQDDNPRYPPPITTTSPPPPDVQPTLVMTTHQKAQGYHPSLNSMFAKPHPHQDNFFLSRDRDRHEKGLFHHHHNSHSHSQSLASRAEVTRSSSIKWESRADAAGGHREEDPEPCRLESGAVLKTVYFPRASLHRFNAIAKANTLINRETCGLLLGKDRKELKSQTSSRRREKDAYVVTTLLIPKQHATSDTCTMDEEESVMQFTEERGLITLGWIHTHPTQTCFMSSVDLHTHSGFQRMLPESFAVVCAPRQKPNYGIFRLTDPSGLQTVLSCKARAAFHPHPDVPIYTDADRGHVVMKDDMTLEIVDLR